MIAFLSVVWGIVDRRWQISWGEKYKASHPELSDEEYLALFETDAAPEIALKVRKILSQVTAIDEARIRPQDRLIEDLKMG